MAAVLMLLPLTPAAAAVSYVGYSAAPASSSGTSSVAITAPAGLSSGDVMIAFVAQNTGTLPAVSSAPAGWIAVLEQDDGASIGGNVYYRIATSADVAGSTSYTWSFRQSARSGGVILDFSGELSSSPIVVSGSQANASSSTYTAPSVTPGVANTMLVALYAADQGNGSVATPAGTTQAFAQSTSAGPNGLGIGAFYESLAASSATGQIQSTGNNAAVNIGVTLAIQPGPTGTPDHYALSYPSGASAVNCQPQPVTITAHSAAHAALATTDTIVVSTSTGHGDFTLSSGNGTFAAGASNSGTAKYTYAALDSGAVTLLLRDTYAETVSILVADGTASTTSGSATASEHLPLTFSASGFRITNGANVATTIGTRIAGLSSGSGAGAQTLALQAIRTDTNTGACTAVLASGASANVSLAYQCNNPTACIAGQTLAITNNGVTTNLASNPNSGVTTYTIVPLKFSTANAEAPFTLSYSDAGQVSLYARYNIPLGSGAGSGNLMLGSSQFVVQPYTFVLSGIKCTTYGSGTCSTALASPGANPGATAASGPAFIPAGQPFTATVTAQNFAGAATPNYGQEIAPPGATLALSLIAPAGGDAAAIGNASAFGVWSAGVATGTTFNWPEVGIITLTPAVANYLGSGAVTGTVSGDVGRFYANGFSVALNTPVLGTGCTAGSFSYLGQPLTYTVAPVATVTALAAGGATARNYTGAFMRITNSSLSGRTYTPTPASPSLNLAGLPATSADPAITDLGNGQASLTFSAGTGIAFNRASAIAPFSANLALAINVIDTDGAVATSPANPITFGAGSGMSFSSGATQYYGRLALRDALGSELLDQPVPLTTQYYASTSVGFTTNAADGCSAAPPLAFGNYQGNLSAGKTCVRDTGSPGISGVGCAAAAPAASQYRSTAAAGSFNLNLAAPGAGNNGSLQVTATAPAWLQYAWGTGSTNPIGIATFGEFPAPASRVHQREVY